MTATILSYPHTSHTYGNLIANGGAGTGHSWATTTTMGSGVAELSNNNGSGCLDLKGPKADVVINGRSLTESIQAIETTLLIPGRLSQNHQLEQEFAELKELGELYRSREQEFLEKRRMWNILKTTDQ